MSSQADVNLKPFTGGIADRQRTRRSYWSASEREEDGL